MKKILLLIVSGIFPLAAFAEECSNYMYLHNNGDFTFTEYNKKGKIMDSATGNYKCENGELYVDMRSSMPSGNPEQFKGMQEEANESYLEYPSNMSSENVTTPAGSWNCFRITSDALMRMKIGIGIPMHFKIVEWFAPGFGIVKTEDFNKNDKLAGTMVLTSITK